MYRLESLSVQGFSVFCSIYQEVKGLLRESGELAHLSSHIGNSPHFHERLHDIVEGSEHVGNLAHSTLTAIFSKRDIPPPLEAIFKAILLTLLILRSVHPFGSVEPFAGSIIANEQRKVRQGKTIWFQILHQHKTRQYQTGHFQQGIDVLFIALGGKRTTIEFWQV